MKQSWFTHFGHAIPALLAGCGGDHVRSRLLGSDTLAYDDRLTASNGGTQATQGFARTVLVPGMAHCSGGPATDRYDSVQTMVDRVEKGIARQGLICEPQPSLVRLPAVCDMQGIGKHRGRRQPQLRGDLSGHPGGMNACAQKPPGEICY